ncbi:MAG TPA: OPT/YSL family transporter, partial [Planctomycetia bacterium]|nr:OPT/YSL family transporter [Planctomycetia bacterium]
SNPISGMTVATLLVTCLIFLALGKVGPQAQLTALTVAAVVCIASSNGGTTAQDLKTGFLVGATPYKQQIAILVGALTSALVMGVTLLALNDAGTIYTKNPKYIPPADYKYADVAALVAVEKPSRGLKEPDDKTYKVLHVAEGALVLKASGKPDFVVEQGKYLIADDGRFAYMVDPAINGRVANDKGERVADNGEEIKNSFNAPKTKLMSFIITGVLGQKLPWDWVILGALIAIVLELCGVASLPFAVGVYLPLATSVPIFIGGMLRWIVERTSKRSAADSESSPGVLLSSGYIAGGTIAGVVAAFLQFAPDGVKNATNLATALVVEKPAATTVDAEKLKGPLAAAREAASGASASGQSLKTALEKAPGGSDETRAAASKIQDAAADLQSRAKSAGDAGRKFKELAPDDGATKSYPEWYDVFQKNEWPSVAVFSLLAVILLFTGYLKVEAPAGVQERTKNGE